MFTGSGGVPMPLSPGGGVSSSAGRFTSAMRSNVQVLNAQRVRFDELAARLYVVTH